MPYGRSLLSPSIVNPTRVSADGNPKYKSGGITIDLTTIPAASSSAVTLPDGSVIAANTQYLRYGQVMTKLGVAEVQTVEFTGGPAAGAATLTLPAAGNDPAQSTAAIPYDASALVFQQALQALTRIGANGVTTARSGNGSSGAPYIYTNTFNRSLGNLPQLTSTHTFTAGNSTTHGTSTAGSGGGKFGPYDPGATDGRQSLIRGDCFILDETYLPSPSGLTLPAANDIIGGVLDGGEVWLDRIVQIGSGIASIGNGPTLANLNTAFPSLTYVNP